MNNRTVYRHLLSSPMMNHVAQIDLQTKIRTSLCEAVSSPRCSAGKIFYLSTIVGGIGYEVPYPPPEGVYCVA
jgi:hypothetical protein